MWTAFLMHVVIYYVNVGLPSVFSIVSDCIYIYTHTHAISTIKGVFTFLKGIL